MAYERFSYVYDRLMEDMPYEEWVRFARGCWDKFGQPRTVVDLGCGTGSIAVPLAQMGYEVIGIDLSEDMLAVAQGKADDAKTSRSLPPGGSVTFLQQDLRDWELGRPADAVISFCDCFNYLLEEDDVEQAIRQAYAGLKPGGVFVFDVHTAEQLIDYAASQPFFLNDEDIAYIWTSEYDESRSEIEHALTIFVQDEENSRGDDTPSGRFTRVEETHTQRAYPLAWLESKLRAAGFREVVCYGDFMFKQATEETRRAFFAAVK
ncbi:MULTISPECIES: class I SAM-dependent DNA methyltransferase [Paenibacillus]|uniref:class I SAM-dependent DNA methyltransferase n=1 Tax=Paenibacillus TaxID=44249 RepID=UPI0022B896DB|nr:class I SAM-dependent methyltransferase [Paenibacillus caseinilyticus]MCZ8518672.1 class I SAM-dependent methyltransferase [Paenibacillus caseinilyticus]